MTTLSSQPIQIGSTVRLTGNYLPLDAQVRLGISTLSGVVEYISGVNHSNVGVRFFNGQFFNCQLSELEVSEPEPDSLSQKIEQLEFELDKTRNLWMQGVSGVFRDHVIKLEIQLSKLKSEQIDLSFAGELAQSSEDSPVATLAAAILLNADDVVQPHGDSSGLSRCVAPPYSQTLLDGVYDVVASGVAKVKARFSKPVDSSPPVQTSLFEYLKPYAKEQYEKMLALFRLYAHDLEQLKNPLSHLSKLLGKRRQSNLDGLTKQASALAKDMTAYGLMWELL